MIHTPTNMRANIDGAAFRADCGDNFTFAPVLYQGSVKKQFAQTRDNRILFTKLRLIRSRNVPEASVLSVLDPNVLGEARTCKILSQTELRSHREEVLSRCRRCRLDPGNAVDNRE